MVFTNFCPPVYLVPSHDKQARGLQMPQVARGHVPRVPVVPLFVVLIEHIILHLPLVSVNIPYSQGKGPAGVIGRAREGWS